MNQLAIRTEGLSRVFGDIHAVSDLSLEAPRGIVFGFLGTNGSGKTTTIRLLLGLLEPSRGKAEVLGWNVSTQADQIRSRSGALLEHTGLYERLSAEDNLEFYAWINQMPQGERQARIRDLLTHFELWDRRQDRVGNWSRGMKQRLAVARALLHRPEIVFLDEPTAGLDPVAAAALRRDIAALAEQEGVTVFLNTHNLPEAEKLCALVGVIRNGRLLKVGHPAELRKGTDVPTLHVRGAGIDAAAVVQLESHPMAAAVTWRRNELDIQLTPDADITTLIHFLIQNGVQVEEVRRNTADLEHVFLKLMEEDAHVV